MSRSNPKAKFGFSTKDKYVEFELTIKVSTEFRFFFLVEELPDQIREKAYGKRMYFDTFTELQSKVEDFIAEFEVSIIEESKVKVIIYAIETGDRHHGRQIDFRWRVAQKVTTSGKKATNDTYFEEVHRSGRHTGTDMREIQSSDFSNDFLEMPWSAEREAWFKAMEDSIASLSHRLDSGFGKTPEILARRIDQGAKLFLNAPDEGKTK